MLQTRSERRNANFSLAIRDPAINLVTLGRETTDMAPHSVGPSRVSVGPRCLLSNSTTPVQSATIGLWGERDGRQPDGGPRAPWPSAKWLGGRPSISAVRLDGCSGAKTGTGTRAVVAQEARRRGLLLCVWKRMCVVCVRASVTIRLHLAAGTCSSIVRRRRMIGSEKRSQQLTTVHSSSHNKESKITVNAVPSPSIHFQSSVTACCDLL